MRNWFYAIHLFLNDKKGVSACNLQRELGVAYKTAFRMLHKIREAMGNVAVRRDFGGFVEVDETLLGGKPRKQNALVKPDGTIIPRKYPKKKSKRGLGSDKTVVTGILERETGRLRLKVAVSNGTSKRGLSGKELLGIIEKACKDGTVVLTDNWKGYNILDNDKRYIHFSVNHSKGEYCNFLNKNIHTNGIENFWSILKRAYFGTYHHYSVKHMQKYLDECGFRYHHRKNERIFDVVLEQAIGA